MLRRGLPQRHQGRPPRKPHRCHHRWPDLQSQRLRLPQIPSSKGTSTECIETGRLGKAIEARSRLFGHRRLGRERGESADYGLDGGIEQCHGPLLLSLDKAVTAACR